MSCEPTSAGFRPEKVKPHRTVTITAALLHKKGACPSALKELEAKRLLPAVISTDPEANLALALRYDRFDRYGTGWSGRNVLYSLKLLPRTNWVTDVADVNDAPTLNRALDPYYLAQVMALVADRILSERGR